MPMSSQETFHFPEGSTMGLCGPEGCEALARFWTVNSYPPRAVIVSESDMDDDVFFVLDGTARAATFTDNGREVMYSDLPKGESFGIFAAVDGQPRSTNVFAKEDSRIARMSGPNFLDVLNSNRDVNLAFMTYLIGLIRHLSNRVTEATTLSTEQRLCAQLLRLSEKSGPNQAHIEQLPTQQELAVRISSQRESVGRELSKLKGQGLILRKGKSMTILNLQGLETKLSDF